MFRIICVNFFCIFNQTNSNDAKRAVSLKKIVNFQYKIKFKFFFFRTKITSACICNHKINKLNQHKTTNLFDVTTAVSSTVRSSLQESIVRLLTPKKRVDILQDIAHSKQGGKPYVITFCGVNGVGKSTNLAKVCLEFF